jgi:hypothetical protein
MCIGYMEVRLHEFLISSLEKVKWLLYLEERVPRTLLKEPNKEFSIRWR